MTTITERDITAWLAYLADEGRDTLAIETGGQNTEYEVMKEHTSDVEVILKYAEKVNRVKNPPQKSRSVER